MLRGLEVLPPEDVLLLNGCPLRLLYLPFLVSAEGPSIHDVRTDGWLHELGHVHTSVPNANKGEGIQNAKLFADMIYGCYVPEGVAVEDVWPCDDPGLLRLGGADPGGRREEQLGPGLGLALGLRASRPLWK